MIKITIGSQVVSFSMKDPKGGVEAAKIHMLSIAHKHGFVKGIPVTIQVDKMVRDSVCYTLDHYTTPI